MALPLPYIPETITVHLGRPESSAPNVTLSFLDYIANVASSEIYPTWPTNAIRANILAETSFALNRVYTEYYRSRGYNFDITNSTAFDQSFVNGRDIFENVRQIAAELFNDYIRRRGNVEPLFAQYCNGTTVTCNGLSQWGTVTLANQGLTPYEILTRYYGNNIDIVTDTPVGSVRATAPTIPLRLGSSGDLVRVVQIRLNRISANYPSIPKIVLTDGVFSYDTEAAVLRFQEIFNLSTDGIVGQATWYTIQNIYGAVKRLNELDSEGITGSEVTQEYPEVLRPGSTGLGVRVLQFYLQYLSDFYPTIPGVAIDGTYGDATRDAVIAVQRYFGLAEDGIVGQLTWNVIYNAYLGIVGRVPGGYTESEVVPYPGVILRPGAESDTVKILQEYLRVIAGAIREIPEVTVTGYYGNQTRDAVLAFQRLNGLEETGYVGPLTWTAIADLYSDIYHGSELRDGQFPGYTVGGN